MKGGKFFFSSCAIFFCMYKTKITISFLIFSFSSDWDLEGGKKGTHSGRDDLITCSFFPVPTFYYFLESLGLDKRFGELAQTPGLAVPAIEPAVAQGFPHFHQIPLLNQSNSVTLRFCLLSKSFS